MDMKPSRYIVDTTLRDGEQTPGAAFAPEEKARAALLLDRAGVYQIEAGTPAIGKQEKDAICRILDRRVGTRIAVWNRLSEADIRHSFDCRPDVIHISAPVSDAHIRTKLKKNRAWLKKRLMECAEFALSTGCKVSVGYEDASRADLSFIESLTQPLEELGVESIRVADTVGVLTPSRAGEIIRGIRSFTRMKVGFHAHNDLGMAVANSLAAARAGAEFIDTTLFGLGERAGNCDMRLFLKNASLLFDVRPAYGDALALEKKLSGMNREEAAQ
jgi:homocitrate synthase NifV